MAAQLISTELKATLLKHWPELGQIKGFRVDSVFDHAGEKVQVKFKVFLPYDSLFPEEILVAARKILTVPAPVQPPQAPPATATSNSTNPYHGTSLNDVAPMPFPQPQILEGGIEWAPAAWNRIYMEDDEHDGNCLLLTVTQWHSLFKEIQKELITKTVKHPSLKGKCTQCSKTFSIINLRKNASNKNICVKCINNFFSACDSCDKYYKASEGLLKMVSAGAYENRFCPSCLMLNCWICVECKNINHNAIQIYKLPNERASQLGFRPRKEELAKEFCYNCYSRYFALCNHCTKLFRRPSLHNCDDCQNIMRSLLCTHCLTAHNCSSVYRNIKRLQFFEGTPNEIVGIQRFIGTEIEVEGEEEKTKQLKKLLPTYIGIVHDGSITGVELLTPPAKGETLVKIINETCKVLVQQGLKGTQRCGFHVHIDCRDIQSDHKKIVQIIKTFYAVEDLFYSMLPPSRWKSRYCQRLSRDYLYRNFNPKEKKSEVEKKWYKVPRVAGIAARKTRKYDETRYYGLNIHSIFFRGTLEIRYHSGTVSPEKIINWISIVLHVFDYAINRYKEKEVANLFDMPTGAEKLSVFYTRFGIPSPVYTYMKERVGKFNPGYIVKFNKGKKEREVERQSLARMRKKIQAEREILRQQAEKEVTKSIVDEWDSLKEWRLHNPPGAFNKLVDARVDELVFRKLPAFYRSIPVDGGFIHDQELNSIVEILEIGMRLGQQQDRDEL